MNEDLEPGHIAFRNDEQKIVSHNYPDLRVNCVLDGPVESLGVNEIFDSLEEPFYLPPFAVQFRDSERAFDGEVVGQEAIKLLNSNREKTSEPCKLLTLTS